MSTTPFQRELLRGPVDRLVIEVIAKLCGIAKESVTPASDLAQLGVDSMGLTTLAAHIEAAHSIELSEALVLRLYDSRSVGEVVDIVREALKTCASAS